MGLGDKIRNAGEEATGKVKEATGKATGNETLEAEGKGDQVPRTSSRPARRRRTPSRTRSTDRTAYRAAGEALGRWNAACSQDRWRCQNR